jgi:hypothetical protein
MTLTTSAAALRSALVRAYRPHVERRLAELGVPMAEGLAAVIDEGAEWLDDGLGTLLSTPFAEQRRGPLEVFQEAMSFPTNALSELGVEPVPRDPVSVNALPGDVYDLAPASSSVLGEDVWRAHLSWGAETAASFRQGVN